MATSWSIRNQTAVGPENRIVEVLNPSRSENSLDLAVARMIGTNSDPRLPEVVVIVMSALLQPTLVNLIIGTTLRASDDEMPVGIFRGKCARLSLLP